MKVHGQRKRKKQLGKQTAAQGDRKMTATVNMQMVQNIRKISK